MMASIGSATRLRQSWIGFGCVALCLCVVFSKALFDLCRFAAGSELYSHIFLIPCLSFYLIWINRSNVRSDWVRRSPLGAGGLVLVAGSLLGFLWVQASRGVNAPTQDWLSVSIAAFVLLLVANSLFFFGPKVVGAMALPVAMLLWIAPFPKGVEESIES